MRAAAALFALALSPLAWAGGGLSVGLHTTHWGNSAGKNESNSFLALSGRRFHCATFENSFYTRTWACGIHKRWRLSALELSILGGAVHGYAPDQLEAPCSGRWCAYVAGNVALRLTENLAAEVTFFEDAVLYGLRIGW